MDAGDTEHRYRTIFLGQMKMNTFLRKQSPNLVALFMSPGSHGLFLIFYPWRSLVPLASKTPPT